MTIKPCERCGKTFNSYFYETVCYKCQTEKNLEVECNECRAKSDEYGAELEAIAAWNRRAQQENKPLTLDELRQMDGEPVWVVCEEEVQNIGRL